MKAAAPLLLFLALAGCSDLPPSGPPHAPALIVVNVHWGSQGVAGIPVAVLQTGDSTCTGTNGLAIFSVPAGQYVVRAYGINRGGPSALKTDYQVDVKPGGIAFLDIPDCLPCL